MISVNPERREFHLKNQNISYIFRVMEELDVLEQLYFGSSIPKEKQEYNLADEIVKKLTSK